MRGLEFCVGTGTGLTLTLLRRYRRARMIVYDNRQHAEHFVRQHLAPKYWSRVDVEEIDMARLSAKRLRRDIERHWGAGHGFASVTHIADGHPCTTLSDAYHGPSPHRHHDSTPKSAKAKGDDHMFEHTLRLIEKVLREAPTALVVIENPRSKAFPKLPGVQRVLRMAGWQLTVGSHCSNADETDGGPWPKKDTMYLTYGAESKALGDERDFELKQCKYDCPWLIDGTGRHALVLCTNTDNLDEQRVEGNAMRKGVVPTGVFKRLLDSHSRRRRQAGRLASAAVASTRSTERTVSAGETKSWLRRRAARQTRLEQSVDDPPARELRRSRRLMQPMPARPEGQPDAGQVCRGSTVAHDHSPTRGEATSASGAVDARPSAEVGANEPAASGFDQPVSDESDGESDSDGGVQARDPTVQEEDSFDANGLRQDRQVRQTRPGTIPVYDVRSSPIKSWGLAIPGQLPNAPRYDKPAMCPWQLSFWDNISTDFKVGGKRSSFLIGVDTVSNGWRVKVQKGKFENGDSIDEVITEEALDKRPYKVTVASDGCGSMSLLRAAALSRGVDHWPLPPYAYDLNIAEGAINHFKQMVSAVMLAAMVPGGPIDESFVGRAAEYCCWTHERLVPDRRGVDGDLSPWRHNFGVDARVACAVAFGTPGFAFVDPELRSKRGAPRYGRAEPVLMIGYRSLYSDTYKCLTQHGTVIHSRQVEWITDAKLGVFPDISQKATVEALEWSMQAEAPGIDLFARLSCAQSEVDVDPSYGAALLRVDNGKLYRADGTLRCRRQYVADRVLQLDGLTVREALKTHYRDAKGEKKRYKRSDLLYDLQCGWLCYELHAGDLGGGEASANTAGAWPTRRLRTRHKPASAQEKIRSSLRAQIRNRNR